jgi:hypothetical protein
VLLHVGPLPAAAARAWLAYARSVVDEQRRTLPIGVVAAFTGYLEEWSEAATGDVFRWEGKADPEEVEYLLHAWFKLATARAEEAAATGEDFTPTEGIPFYTEMVRSILNALRSENRSTAAFADHLAAFWPGLG